MKMKVISVMIVLAVAFSVFTMPVKAEGELEIEVREAEITEGDSISGKVMSDGKVVQNADVSLMKGNETVMSTVTDKNGEFVFGNLGIGAYYIKAVKDDYTGYAYGIEVTYKKSMYAEIPSKVTEGFPIQVTVKDEHGNVKESAFVSLISDKGISRSGLTDSDGKVSFIAPSVDVNTTLSIQVTAEGYAVYTSDIQITPIIIKKIASSVSEKKKLKVTVTDIDGNALKGITVSLYDRYSKAIMSDITDSNGTAVIPKMPSVDKNTDYNIVFTKNGELLEMRSVTVKNVIKSAPAFEFLFILGALGLLFLFKRRL